MCVAIYNHKSVKLPKEVFEVSFKNNGHGVGMLWTENGVLKNYKAMTDGGFYELYEKVKTEFPDTNIVLHFRLVSAGEKNVENCHPFMVNDNLGFVHNGTMTKYKNHQSKMSDTWHFNEELLKQLPEDFILYDGMSYLLREEIGIGSKLIFLNGNNVARIINLGAGVTDEAYPYCWFSNGSYKDTRKSYTYDDDIRDYRKYNNYSVPRVKAYDTYDKQVELCDIDGAIIGYEKRNKHGGIIMGQIRLPNKAFKTFNSASRYIAPLLQSATSKSILDEYMISRNGNVMYHNINLNNKYLDLIETSEKSGLDMPQYSLFCSIELALFSIWIKDEAGVLDTDIADVLSSRFEEGMIDARAYVELTQEQEDETIERCELCDIELLPNEKTNCCTCAQYQQRSQLALNEHVED